MIQRAVTGIDLLHFPPELLIGDASLLAEKLVEALADQLQLGHPSFDVGLLVSRPNRLRFDVGLAFPQVFGSSC